MGRPKTFDDDQVLDQVVACFRQNGYTATSIRDLEGATNLKAASLYKAFGNKAALFALALGRYSEQIINRRIATYLTADRQIDGIRQFFVSTYRDEPLPDHGCLFTTAAIEAAHVDAVARAHVDSGLADIRDAFREQIGRCQRTGEVAPKVDAEAAAQVLLLLYEGLLVLLRSGSGVVGVSETINVAIDALLLAPD